MILISGQPVQPSVLSQYAPGNVEKKAADLLSASSERYSYDSPAQLDFELRLRRAIVAAAVSLNQSGMDFEIFRKSRCNPEFWDRTQEGGFRLKAGANPAQAIRDIFRHGSKYATECATAMVIVYYRALLEIFGENRFNRVFPKIELMNWHLVDPLLLDVGLMKKRADYLPGDRRYFANPDVDPLTPEWQGENVIDLNGKMYYGHGIGIDSADAILRELNKNRIKNANESAYLVEAAGRPDFKKLFSVYERTPDA